MAIRKERQLIDGVWHTKPKRGVPKPLTRNGGWMTESEYFSMIRSALRRLTIYWKPRAQCLLDARRACKKGLQKWEYKCASCNKWFKQKEVEADHIKEAGTLTKDSDVSGFIKRLLAEEGGWQCLCKPCHKEKTHGTS